MKADLFPRTAGASTATAIAIAIAIAVSLAFVFSANAATNDAVRAGRYFERVANDPSRGAELDMLTTMLPKGGDIHHHYSGAIYAETYLDWVGRQGYCVVADTLRIEKTQPVAPAPGAGNCLTADAIRADEPTYRRLLMRWSDKDYGNHNHDQLPPDQQFFDTFGLFAPVSGYATHDGLAMLKQRALAENVQYIETMLRGAPRVPMHPEAEALDTLPASVTPEALDPRFAAAFDALDRDGAAQDAVRAYQAGVAADAAGIDGQGFVMRFQTYVNRNARPSQVFSTLYAAFKSSQESPLIVGVNIVGPENGVVAMRDYELHMRMFHFLKTRFPGAKLSLHAGELALGMVPPEGLRNHIRLAVDEAGANRIGHGVDIAHEDDTWPLLDEMKAAGIAVEINLSSNEFILGVTGPDHPVALYLRAGVPIVICTDDAGVSRSSLSHEYALFVRRYKPSYGNLKNIVYASVRHSFLSAADKQSQLKELDLRFAQFEKMMAARGKQAEAQRR